MKTKYQIHKERMEVLNELLNEAADSPNIHKNSYVYPILKEIAKEYDEEFIYNEIDYFYHYTLADYIRGSSMFGTYEFGISDLDHLAVVDNCCHNILDEHPRHMYELKVDSLDCQFICEDDFINMIKESNIEALECVFYFPTANKGKYLDLVDIDKWKLRESVSSICSNSWVKAKKKLTVEKDYNPRIAQKSLWHSMRLYMFGIQIAKTGKIYDFQEANPLWDEIKNAENPTWEYYKEKYHEKFNNLRSELVKLCPKSDNNEKK